MTLARSDRDEIGEITAQIAEVEHLIHKRIDMLVVHLKKGLNVSDDERRIGEMRSVLDILRTRRGKLVSLALVLDANDEQNAMWKKKSAPISTDNPN